MFLISFILSNLNNLTWPVAPMGDSVVRASTLCAFIQGEGERWGRLSEKRCGLGGIDVHHSLPHSMGPNAVIWPHCVPRCVPGGGGNGVGENPGTHCQVRPFWDGHWAVTGRGHQGGRVSAGRALVL